MIARIITAVVAIVVGVAEVVEITPVAEVETNKIAVATRTTVEITEVATIAAGTTAAKGVNVDPMSSPAAQRSSAPTKVCWKCTPKVTAS
jgi:hypothetical protein